MMQHTGRGRGRRARTLAVVLAFAAGTAGMAPAVITPAAGSTVSAPDPAVTAATHTGAALRLVGRNDLGGAGLNGDVATLGTTVIVGAGVVVDTGDHTERYNPIPCFPAMTVKIVDASDPATPKVVATIPLPTGVAAIDVDALRVATPSFTGDLLAVALDDGPSHQGPSACTPSTATNPRGVAYYDISTPASPQFLGRYEADIETAPPDSPPCGPPSATNRCAVGQHSVHLVQRADGKVLSVSSEPLASHPVVNAVNGDLRIVDVTNPRSPTLVGAWPPLGSRPSPFSTNGCRRFNNNHAAITDETGTRAHVAYMDDGLFNLDISNPAAVKIVGQFDYPTDRAFEGNAAYVTTGDVGGRSLALLSEEDWVAPTTRLRIDAPASLAGIKFACENMATLFDVDDNAQIYRRPGAQVAAPIVYVGRGCPARGTPVGSIAADPYLASGAGRIVAVDAFKHTTYQPDISNTSCNFPARLARAQAEGAVGLIYLHRLSAPFQATPLAISYAGNGIGVDIPGIAIDEPDGDALRSTLCPSVVGGVCSGAPVSTGAMVDTPGEWGGLRILDNSNPAAPTSLSVYRTARSQVFPPPDLGVYSVGHVELRGTLAYAAWNADGLRVLDVSNPAAPVEVASFVPPDTKDPQNTYAAKAQVVGVDTIPGHVVISDMNSGLYILAMGAGYWSAAADGGVFAFGAADFHGSMGGTRLNRPVVGMAPTPSGKGYWLVASDGGVFAFGDARFFGSTGAITLNRPIVGMQSTPSGKGYWLVASDGGVFAFGDAAFYGSTGALRLNSPVVGMAATPSGKGYWMVAADGGVFAFGDASFRGSTGAIRLNRPVVGMAPTVSGRGYQLVASDGGVFAFGDAQFFGSTGGIRLNSPVVGAQATPSGRGYWMVAADGGIFAFGDASFVGSTGAIRLNSPVVGMGAFPH
jgi:hypothetical protein